MRAWDERRGAGGMAVAEGVAARTASSVIGAPNCSMTVFSSVESLRAHTAGL